MVLIRNGTCGFLESRVVSRVAVINGRLRYYVASTWLRFVGTAFMLASIQISPVHNNFLLFFVESCTLGWIRRFCVLVFRVNARAIDIYLLLDSRDNGLSEGLVLEHCKVLVRCIHGFE